MLHALYRERDQYNNLINSLRGAISSLSEGKGNIDDAAKLVSYYTVDDNPTDNGAFSSSAEEISNMVNTLAGEVIPWIERHIHDLSKTIADLELAESMKE